MGFNEFPVVHNRVTFCVLMSFQWYIIELHSVGFNEFQWYIIELHSVGFNEFPVVHNRVTFCGF